LKIALRTCGGRLGFWDPRLIGDDVIELIGQWPICSRLPVRT
jgi:hypothetical protein